MKIAVSPLDGARFGIRTAKALEVTEKDVDALLAFCAENTIQLCIARCPTMEWKAVQSLEQKGFRRMDTLVYFSRRLTKTPALKNTCDVPIRPLKPGEEQAVKRLAEVSFKDYPSHYYVDDRLPKSQVGEIYPDWVYRQSCSKEPNQAVLVAERQGEIVGFATLRLNQPGEGEGVLFAVSPAAQGLGIYKAFMIRGLEWCLAQGAKKMIVSTQIGNLMVQKVWVQLGFEPLDSMYTLHGWF